MLLTKIPTKSLSVLFSTFIILSSMTVTGFSVAKQASSLPVTLDVYKTINCGCCKKWIDHIDSNGFQSNVHSQDDISGIKKNKGIAPRYRSCHTAISKQGYVFEGHVPAKFIQQFLQENHASDVLGLAVPAMPVGTPGMEVGDKFHAYKILLLKDDGSYEVYVDIQSYQEQF